RRGLERRAIFRRGRDRDGAPGRTRERPRRGGRRQRRPPRARALRRDPRRRRVPNRSGPTRRPARDGRAARSTAGRGRSRGGPGLREARWRASPSRTRVLRALRAPVRAARLPRGELRLALAGDTMLGRGVAERLSGMPASALVAPEVTDAFREADVALLNLACCIS